MRIKRTAVIVAAGAALVAGGATAAVGATGGDDATEREAAIIEDAAKRLDRTPQQLRDALRAAQDAQLDQAVEDGELTQEQADAIKERRNEAGRVLGFPGGRGHHHHGGPGFGRGGLHGVAGDLGAEVAKALGITRAELREQLRDGKSVADIAKAEGRSLDTVKSHVRAAARTRLDKAVADGDLTRAQADRALEHLDEHIDRFAQAGGLGRRGGRPHFGPRPALPLPPAAGDEDPALDVVPAPDGTRS